MTTTAPPGLDPVVNALLDAAHADADRTLTAARGEGERTRQQALDEELRIRRTARAAGEADGRRSAASSTRRERRSAQRTVLEAQQEAHTELRRRVLERLAAFRTDPSYSTLLDSWGRQARAALGSDARVEEHPEGGVVATVTTRRLTLSFPDVVDRNLEALGPELEGLWRS